MRVSEVFYSLQGEGLRVGTPSLFVRFFGCNFRCPGFGLPPGQKSTEPDEIAKNIDAYHSYDELPLAKTGCDSYPSWHPKFAKFSPDLTVDQLYEKMLNVVNLDIRNSDVVFTGGEPLLPKTQDFIIQLLKEKDFSIFNTITFETNGTQMPKKELIDLVPGAIFSISPKLKCSGVPPEKAIKPEVIDYMNKVSKAYVKFVINSDDDINEILDILKLIKPIDVYLMPEGGVAERYEKNMKVVAEIAMKYGFIFSPRLHVSLFGNGWAT